MDVWLKILLAMIALFIVIPCWGILYTRLFVMAYYNAKFDVLNTTKLKGGIDVSHKKQNDTS